MVRMPPRQGDTGPFKDGADFREASDSFFVVAIGCPQARKKVRGARRLERTYRRCTAYARRCDSILRCADKHGVCSGKGHGFALS